MASKSGLVEDPCSGRQLRM